MLPSNFTSIHTDHEQKETILHEKVHIFQRVFPVETNVLLTHYWQYAINGIKSNMPRVRANPDTNNILYRRGSVSECYQRYNSDTPRDLADSVRYCVKGVHLYEHPYEQMAYIIADLLCHSQIKNEDYIQVVRWMSTYF